MNELKFVQFQHSIFPNPNYPDQVLEKFFALDSTGQIWKYNFKDKAFEKLNQYYIGNVPISTDIEDVIDTNSDMSQEEYDYYNTNGVANEGFIKGTTVIYTKDKPRLFKRKTPIKQPKQESNGIQQNTTAAFLPHIGQTKGISSGKNEESQGNKGT